MALLPRAHSAGHQFAGASLTHARLSVKIACGMKLGCGMGAIGRTGIAGWILIILAGVMLCLAPARASPEEKRRLVLGTATTYGTFDPHVVDDPGQNIIRLNFYDSLLRWVGSPPHLQLWLAARHEMSPDGQIHTFYLRDDAKFHDGSPVRAADAEHGLGDGPQQVELIDFLKCVSLVVRGHHCAADGQYRSVGLPGERHSGDEIGDAGSTLGKTDADAGRRACIGIRHVHCRLLVPDTHEFDIGGVVHRIEDFQIRGADDAERVADPLRSKTFHDCCASVYFGHVYDLGSTRLELGAVLELLRGVLLPAGLKTDPG